MVNTSIYGTSPDGYRDVIGLPHCGGSSLPTGRQPDKQEKELTTFILSNGNKSEVSIVLLTHGKPLAYEVNFIKVEEIADNHVNYYFKNTNHKIPEIKKVIVSYQSDVFVTPLNPGGQSY
jgi:hypothetical protein